MPRIAARLFSIPKLNLALTHGLLIIFTGVSPEFIGSRMCVPVTFTAESPKAQGPQSSM